MGKYKYDYWLWFQLNCITFDTLGVLWHLHWVLALSRRVREKKLAGRFRPKKFLMVCAMWVRVTLSKVVSRARSWDVHDICTTSARRIHAIRTMDIAKDGKKAAKTEKDRKTDGNWGLLESFTNATACQSWLSWAIHNSSTCWSWSRHWMDGRESTSEYL